jgi:protein SCO1/2
MSFRRLELALISCVLAVGIYIGTTGSAINRSEVAEINEQKQLTQWLDRDEQVVQKQYEHLKERAAELSDGRLEEFKGERVSDRFPDVVLTNHYGVNLRFRSDLVRDKTTCFAMFYTRCEGTCPGTISKMLKIRESLTSQFGRDNIQFVCITLDPENDGPQELLEYATSVGGLQSETLADIHFCTGSKDDVELVRRALGMYDLDPIIDADRTQHAAMIVMGADRFNRWASSPSGLPVQELHETCLRIAGASERQRFGLRLALDSGFTPAALADVAGAPAGYDNAKIAVADNCCSKSADGSTQSSCCSKAADGTRKGACCSSSVKDGSCCSQKTKGSCCQKPEPADEAQTGTDTPSTPAVAEPAISAIR